jgi:hypothetical protein
LLQLYLRYADLQAPVIEQGYVRQHVARKDLHAANCKIYHLMGFGKVQYFTSTSLPGNHSLEGLPYKSLLTISKGLFKFQTGINNMHLLQKQQIYKWQETQLGKTTPNISVISSSNIPLSTT